MQAQAEAVCSQARAAARIAVERIAEIADVAAPRPNAPPARLVLRFVHEPGEGFALTVRDSVATISADQPREFIAGVGKLLALLRATQGGGAPAGAWRESPRLPVRSHYMPGHFGNAYEVAWPGEMQRYLEDLALWGSSGYSDWFDPNDMPDPFSPHVYCSTSMSLWHRKKDFLRRAKALGLDTAVGIAHNVGFVDQMRPEWVGVRSLKHRVQGQVLCPSIPEARAVCLKNHENLFADLAETGVAVDKFAYGTYDDGGCACEKCQPYFPTFLKMVAEIHEIARRYFPGVRADLCGWWVTEEETRQVEEFARGPAREWMGSFQISVAYEAWGAAGVSPILREIPQSIFFHIGYSQDKRDAYLATGIHSAPRRIREVIAGVVERGCTGFHTYNESLGDHYNQFLCTRLARVPEADLGELTREYCRQMYGLAGSALEEMARVLQDMEMLEEEKAGEWIAALERLAPLVRLPPRQPWAFEHVALKAQLMALDRQIGTGEGWRSPADVAPVLPLIERRLELSERLWRVVYGLGVLRHIFIPLFTLPAWHGRYVALQPPTEIRLKPNFVRVSRNA